MNPERTVRRLAHRLGVGEAALYAYDQLAPGTPVRNVDRSLVDPAIRQFEGPDPVDGRVLIPLIQGRQAGNAYKYAILAHAFRTRGYEPVLPLCHADLPLCHELPHDRVDRSLCDLCHYQTGAVLDAFGLEGIELATLASEAGDGGELPSDPQPGDDVSYRGIDVGSYAMASSRKVLKRYHLDPDDETHVATYRRLLAAGRFLIDAGHALFERYEFDAVVAHDVNYVYGGLFLALAEHYGVPGYSNAYGFTEETVLFGNQKNRMATAEYTRESTVEAHLADPLTDAAKAALTERMDARMAGTGSTFEYAASTGRGVDLDDDVVVGLFTNVIWDDSLAYDGEDLLEYFEWLDHTVEFFVENPEYGLVCKTHPAEAVHGTNEPIGAYVREAFGDLPENVVVLEPTTDVDTYAVLDEVDVAAVYNSTVGLEAAYLGTPVVVAGMTHYRDYGFTFDAGSPEEYVDFLARASSLSMDETMRERARRYAHLLFVAKQVPFPYVTFEVPEPGNERNVLHPVGHDEIAPPAEPWDTVVERILADEAVTLDGSQS